MAEIFGLLSAKKESILKLSLGVLLGLAGSVPAVQAQTLADDSGAVQQASYGRGRDCYPQYYQDCQPSVADSVGGDGSGNGDGTGDGAAVAPVVPFGEEDLYASNDTMANSPADIAPNMIGDYYMNGLIYTNLTGGGSVPLAGGDRRFKIADNNNPLPMDRIFFNYHDFNNAVTGGDGLDYDVNRYTFGLEKTFWDGMASFEFRVPFASGLTATQQVGGGAPSQGVEFGNLTGVLKFLILQTDTTVVSGGMSGTFATARNAQLYNGAVQEVQVDNEAVFLQPFIGASYLDLDGYFVTFFGAMDFDVTGDGVTYTPTGATAQVYNQTLMYADLALGKWLYRNPYADGIINGIAPVVELHYTTTTTDSDTTTVGGAYTFSNPYNRSDVLNILGGVHFLVGERSMLTLTGGAPLRTQDGNRYYDSEIGIRFNHYY